MLVVMARRAAVVAACMLGACAARVHAPPRALLADSARKESPTCCGPDRFKLAFDAELAKLDAWLVGRTFVDQTDAAGQTLLHNFIAWGHLEAARRVLEQGADPNATDARGATSLQI